MTSVSHDTLPSSGASSITERRVIGGKYRLEALLGRGARGEVYRATQLDLDRDVALKLLSDLRDADGHERFVREAKITAGIRHPCIAEVFDAGIDADGTPYYAMELLRGETLAARLDRDGRIPHAEAVTLAAGICSALGAAHAKGFLHRDVKPSNVFIARREDGGHDPKLIDFGIAKRLPSQPTDEAAPVTVRGIGPRTPAKTALGIIVGTPRYLSPEQIMGDALDARSDLYSLGVTLYEVLAGSAPFSAPDTQGLLQKILIDDPEPIRSRAPDADVPPALDRVVLRALAKDPKDRYPSASDLASALWAAAAEARTSSPTPVPAPLSEGRRSVRIVATGAIVAFLFAMALFVIFRPRPKEAAPPPAPIATAAPAPPAPPAPTNAAPVIVEPAAIAAAPTTTADARPAPTARPRGRIDHAPTAAPTQVAASPPPAPPSSGFRIDDLKAPFR